MKLYYFIINVLKSIIFVNLIFKLLLEYSVFEVPPEGLNYEAGVVVSEVTFRFNPGFSGLQL